MEDKNGFLCADGTCSQLDLPENFFNRELSWLKFNRRVLGEANVKDNPLLERLKFLAITSSNLDEFFMIRLAGLKQQQGGGVTKVDVTGLSVAEQIKNISQDTHKIIKLQYYYLRGLLKQLKEQGIYFKKTADLNDNERKWVENYFHNTIFPVVTPMAVDAGHPFPFLANLTLNLAVTLSRNKEQAADNNNLLDRDKSSDTKTAVIQVPRVLPRIIEILAQNQAGKAPETTTPGETEKITGVRQFIFLEDIIEYYCAHFFHGYTIKSIVPFRITRNSDLDIAEEEAQDLLAEVEKSLHQRDRGKAVRLEIGKTKNINLRRFIIRTLGLEEQDVYEVPEPGYVDLTCFFKFIHLPGFEKFCYPPFTPQVPCELIENGEITDMFAAISKKDILIHHPYESFDPVVEFVRQAATDPRVLAIKQTLYRVSGNAPIVRALAKAAENSKQVTVLVELKARFDEENNILWAKRLEEAGCHVIYGLIGLKTHSKMILVVRREYNGIKRYVHMGTGNYNDTTAKVYADLGLFTANDQFGADASAFFNVLSGYSDIPAWNKITVAPIGLREKFKELIDNEIRLALMKKNGESQTGGRIIAKMNSLVDKDIILKLYEASCQGVKIDLIVRGICSLRPGVPNVSENITVRSIIGQFLEHHRIFYFGNGSIEDAKVFLSSADWMPRNFDDRVELLFGLEDPVNIKRVKDMLELMLIDNQKTHVMQKDGIYKPMRKNGKPVNSQMIFYAQAQGSAGLSDNLQAKPFQFSARKKEPDVY